jgi:hypothetical protein
MARDVVVDLDIEGGKQLIDALDEAGFPVQSAFWLFRSESDSWRLVISTPVADKEGSLGAYHQIQPILHDALGSRIRLDRISAVGTKDRVVKALRSRYRSFPKEEVEGLRLYQTRTDDVFIEGAYVYRVQ